MIVYIYSLNDPETGEIRYIGKTNNLVKRYCNHNCKKLNTRTSNWIYSLKLLGLKPVLRILEETDGFKWEEVERYWILEGRRWGLNLTNHLDGGGPTYNDYSKLKNKLAPNKGKAAPQWVKDKISAGMKLANHSWKTGRKQSQETIEKRMSKCRKVLSGQAKLSLNQVLDIRSGKENNTTLVAKHNVSLRTIQRVKAGHVYNFNKNDLF